MWNCLDRLFILKYMNIKQSVTIFNECSVIIEYFKQ